MCVLQFMKKTSELPHDKTKKMICLRSAWASAQSDQSSLCTQYVVKGPIFLHAESKNSDQTGPVPRLI